MKKVMKQLATIVLSATVLTFGAQAQQAKSLDELLAHLAEGKIAQSKQNKEREANFIARKSEQDALLKAAENERHDQVNTSQDLETQFEENEFRIADLNGILDKRLGSLKELFGVLQQVSGDTKSKFQNSVISAEFSGRGQFLDELAQKMGSSSQLASIEEMERVWFEIQREMTESGKIKRFQGTVVEANGTQVNKEIVRVGAFNLVADGKYLEYVPETGTVAELIRQPSNRILSQAQDVQDNKGELVNFALDPTGGSILGLLVQAPSTQEQVEQGGNVGYIILIVGAIGLLIAFERFISLSMASIKMNRQLKSDVANDNNPLGRVMKVKDQYPNADTDTLELKLSEAILREVPKLTRNLTLIKIVSVVAPLLGLLGTVTGMIVTFQMITLFGTGDPKLMAGGISQALVTTVLGLVVAIPMVFLSTMLNTRSRNMINVLQEQSAGIIAERSERFAQQEKGA